MSDLPIPVLLYFLAIIVPVHFFVGSLYLTTVRLLLLVMIIPMGINLLRGKYGRIFLTDIAFFMFLIWMAISLAVTSPHMVVTQLGSMGVEFYGGYLLGRVYVQDEKTLVSVIYCLLMLIFISLPFAIHEAITGNPIIIETIRRIPGLTSENVITYPTRLGLERAQVMLAHPIHYGLFCSTAFSLTLVGLQGSLSNAKILLGAIGISTGVFLSLSSGALLSIVLQFFLILWAWSTTTVPKRWTILVGILVLLYVLVDLLSNRTPIQVFMYYATFSAHNAYYRGLIFEWGMFNVWAKPAFGIGFTDWVRPWFMRSGTVDNFWLVIAMQYGIPGFATLALGYVIALWRVGMRTFEKHTRIWQLRQGWMLMFAGLTFSLTTVHIWTTIFSFVFFLFGSGMWFITADTKTRQEKTETRDKNTREMHYARTGSRDLKTTGNEENPKTSSSPRYTRF